MAFKGIDVRQSGDRLIFRALLQDSAQAVVTSGTASLYLFELQPDGTLKTYDFSDNTFKSTSPTTATVSMTHRTGSGGTLNTGLWTYVLATVSGFTRGNVYFAYISHSGAAPTVQAREWQYGEAQGDFTVDSSGKVVLQSTQTGVVIPTVTNVTNDVGITQSAADKVWSTTSRTLSSFGTLVSDIWNNATRRLTNLDDTRAAKIDNLDINVGSRSSHSALDVWLVSLNAAFTANSLGKWIFDFFGALGSDKRVQISEDTHDSGVTVQGVTDVVTLPDTAATLAKQNDILTAIGEVSGDWTDEQKAELLDAATRINNVPGTSETPVFVIPTPDTVGLVNVLCRSGDFGTPRDGTAFTFKLASKAAFIGEEYQVGKQRTKKTSGGECLVDIPSSDTLATKGVSPATYIVSVNNNVLGEVSVPVNGGLLKMVDGVLTVEAAA
jgi:hypothetical protein